MKMSSKPTSSPSVSACFQEELVNTIHGAFQVAVEITVQEVTKLLVQKMGDLRGTVTHTQRENDTLKQRLQEAEEQLEILRAYVGAECSSPPPPSGAPSGDPEPVMEDEMMAEVKTEPEEDTDNSEDQDRGTFREICADGSVLSQQYHSETSTLPGHADPQQELSALSKTDCAEPLPPRTTGDAALPLPPRPRDEEDHDDDDMSGVVRPRATEDTPSGTTHHARGTTTEDSSCNVQLVKIKVEDGSPSKEDAGPVDCCFAAEEADFAPIDDDDELSSSLVQPKMEEEDDFGPDSLSLVQSQIMEEWKPSEMLLDAGAHSHRRPEPVVVPGSSRSLAHPSDLPQLSGVSAPDYSSPGDFSNMLTPGDMASTQGTSSSSSVVYGVNVKVAGGHSSHPPGVSAGAVAAAPPPSGFYPCKLCGHTFHAPSVLRRHQGHCQLVMHQRQQQLQAARQQAMAARSQGGSSISIGEAGPPRREKLQLYPPGCSPFRCTVCNREFNRAENLKTHLRIHTGERPYPCSVCAKSFRHSGALKRHFRIHTGEKPYECAQCGKAFRNCGGLKFHERSAHGHRREYGAASGLH